MSLRLRDLIRQVRACKTAAEERAVIAKESAMIRTAIREEQAHYRHRNVAKLLFMHMLGYPTHFGQLECMKLIASPHFPEKRIGYLGMMLLLSEEADVLMLATNALKNDLNNENRFVSGLALCAIANLATADMSRDLAPEVEKHLQSAQPYLRKKACLAMARCLTKCPEMAEDYAEKVVSLLKDRSHGVLITVVQLMTQVLIVEEKFREEEGDNDEESPVKAAFLRVVPWLVKLLRNLLTTGYSPDHDVGGISDPFLQVQILTLFRLLGAGDANASEEMNDVLAQVATNTETAKNAGNAILYECVQTIMAIESEDNLRVLAVNILGRFLLNKDNNIRYVALNTLSKCIADQKEAAREDENIDSGDGPNSAAAALQRHRTTIVDCLKDPDISIRQRALELIYHLVNKENVEGLTAELLNYLVLCPREHRADICSRVLRVVEKYCPDDMWRVDTLITMLTIAGRECSRTVLSSTIIYISHSSEDLRAYAAHKLLKAIRDDDGSQRGLLVVGIWCIGEYGDLLLKPYSYTPSVTDGTPVTVSFMALEPSSIVATIEDVSTRHTCTLESKEHAITCFTKLSDRFANAGHPETLERLHELVKKHATSQNLELQLRSCEYDALLNAMKGISLGENKTDDIFGSDSSQLSNEVIKAAKEALARMPVVDLSIIKRKKASVMEEFDQDDEYDNVGTTDEAPAPGGDLLDLADIFGGGDTSAAPSTTKQLNGSAVSGEQKGNDAEKSDVDLLSDIFSAPATTSNVMPTLAPVGIASQPAVDMFASTPSIGQANTQASSNSSNLLADVFSPSVPNPQPNTNSSSLDMFGATPNNTPAGSMTDVFGGAAPQQPNLAAAPEAVVVVPGFTHAGISVEFECTKPDVWNKQKSILVAQISNNTDAPIYGLNLQCAVPKYITMEMNPPSSTTVPVTAGSQGKKVTQTVNVTNTMLGTKNLMLKIKVSFTSKGTKVEHMATCASFDAGKF
mmetsp:Transcript_10726/g.10252  ORF Transcript_10726/g.10252 Transcript_10726/m.10252 type:complete len:973 (-) Transcript_10726:198-3116(-)|eukprot:CAMPEP_0197835974 /NCGR_PEP_ID=MMETSP1437-20131217/27589_1 /TAXON_ID=49252 ORGANISM="Eucampia antarctica, Strain CCMP1452" /NCGR_SAMPLE_ID=MMETSP1437 /ASSEMBLY_ACC=CAM_ASM_001096 /LENGTH=972 /DNA_ID=CAMNT_0043441807 /DNA_START=142 /DNA_END=3060 /DNA_ORIENTATION=+